MAETLIAASARITFSSIANTGIALKRLRDGMKHAPENLAWLAGQLDCLQIILSDLEASIPRSLDQHGGAEGLVPSMEGCQAALDSLQKLLDDLGVDIFEGNWNSRTKAKFKAVMKDEQVRHYLHRLDFTVRLLSLAQQSYIAKLTQLLPQQLMLELQQHRTEQSEDKAAIQATTVAISDVSPLQCSERRQRSSTNVVVWNKPKAYGYVYYKPKPASQKHLPLTSQLQIQLPRWLIDKAWNFCLERAHSGWKINLYWSTIHNNPLAWNDAFWQGPRDEIFKTLAQQGIQLCDRFETGYTLTQHALMFSRTDIALELLEQGAPLDPHRDLFMGLYPLFPPKTGKWINLEDDMDSENRRKYRSFVKQLMLRNMLDEVLENPMQSSLSASTLNRFLLYDIDMVNLLFGALNIPQPPIIWNNIPWHIMPAKTAIDLLNSSSKDGKARFYESVRVATAESIRRFAICFFRIFGLDATGANTYTSEMCTILGAYAPLHILSSPCLAFTAWTPLYNALLVMRSVTPYSRLSGNRSNHERQCKARLQEWLLALYKGGVDLEQYGRQEATALQQSRTRYPVFPFHTTSYWKIYPDYIIRIEYGPEVKDWELHWEYCHPEYAREFWQCIEFDPKMPGAWVEN